MAEHWISSADAIDLAAQRYYDSGRYGNLDVSRAVAEDALLKRLASAAMRARANKCSMQSGDPLGSEKRSEYDGAEIPSAFWKNLIYRENDEREIDWVLGDFSYSFGQDDHCGSGVAFNVFFEVSGLPGALTLLRLDSSTQGNLPQAAGRPSKYDWVAATLAIFGLIHRGDFKPQSQADVEVALIEHLRTGDSAPGESTVRPYAKLVWEESLKA